MLFVSWRRVLPIVLICTGRARSVLGTDKACDRGLLANAVLGRIGMSQGIENGSLGVASLIFRSAQSRVRGGGLGPRFGSAGRLRSKRAGTTRIQRISPESKSAMGECLWKRQSMGEIVSV